MFYEQFIALCARDNIKPTTLLVTLGMSKGSLKNWRDGKLPSGDILVRFSEHFGVSLDYLVFGTDKAMFHVSPEDREFLDLMHALPKEVRIEFKGELKGYLKCFSSMSDNDEELIAK